MKNQVKTKKKREGRESKFLSELRKDAIDYYGDRIFYHKIADFPLKTIGKDGKYQGTARFGRPKPFDFFAIKDGITFAVEGKAHGTKNSWATSTVSENQIKNLKAAATSGAVSYVILLVEYKYDEIKDRFGVVLGIDDILKNKSYTINDLKSMRTFRRDYLMCANGKMKKIWDVTKIFDIENM